MIAPDLACDAVPQPIGPLLDGHGGRDRLPQRGGTAEVRLSESQGQALREAGGGITVLIAPSGFKERLGPRQVAAAIAEGVRAAIPSARVLQVPIIDGGEGFAEEMANLSEGTVERVYIVGPHGESLTQRLGLIGSPADRTAVIGLTEAVNLRQLPPDRRDPTSASSRGVGLLIAAALDRGVRRIVIGCGDSGANDGGIGMASALGVRFLDAHRSEIVEAGGLLRLESIDMSHRDPRLDYVSIEVVVDPCNDLLGERGVVRVHGPGTGVSKAQVLRLENGLARYADVIERALGVDVAQLRGGGASGGLGAGLVVFAGATLIPRLEFLQHCQGLEASLAAADLVITDDDCVDPLRAIGDASVWIARRAKALGLPVISLAGQFESDDQAPAVETDVSTSTAPAPNRDEALVRTGAWLRDASASAMRIVLRGLALGAGIRRAPSRQVLVPGSNTPPAPVVRWRPINP